MSKVCPCCLLANQPSILLSLFNYDRKIFDPQKTCSVKVCLACVNLVPCQDLRLDPKLARIADYPYVFMYVGERRCIFLHRNTMIHYFSKVLKILEAEQDGTSLTASP